MNNNLNEYRVILYQVQNDDASKDWVAKYVELPDIIGVGATQQEALEEANIHKDMYIQYLEDQNKPLPKTNNYADVSGRITLRMSKSLHQKLIDISEIENVSLNNIINEALISYTTKIENDKNTVQNTTIHQHYWGASTKETYSESLNNNHAFEYEATPKKNKQSNQTQ